MGLSVKSKFEGGAILVDDNGNKFVKIDACQLNFPHLLAKKKFKTDKGDGNYSVRILLPKASKKAVKDVLLSIGKELAAEKKLDWSKLKDDHKFLVDGDKNEYAEEDGHYVVKTKESRRPTVRRKDKEILSPSDEGAAELVYSGVFADVIIGFYAYNTGEYKGVKANPKSVRLLERGEAFSNSGGIEDEEFYDDDDGGDEGFDRDDENDL